MLKTHVDYKNVLNDGILTDIQNDLQDFDESTNFKEFIKLMKKKAEDNIDIYVDTVSILYGFKKSTNSDFYRGSTGILHNGMIGVLEMLRVKNLLNDEQITLDEDANEYQYQEVSLTNPRGLVILAYQVRFEEYMNTLMHQALLEWSDKLTKENKVKLIKAMKKVNYSNLEFN